MQMHLMRKYGGCRLAEYQWFDKVHGWQDNATIGKLSGSQEPNGFLSSVGTQSCRPKEVFVRLFAEARNNQKLTKSQISDSSGKLVCRSHTGILSVSCMENDDGTDSETKAYKLQVLKHGNMCDGSNLVTLNMFVNELVFVTDITGSTIVPSPRDMNIQELQGTAIQHVAPGSNRLAS